MKSKFYLSLDSWRGLACLLVVFCHIYGSLETKINIPRLDVFKSIVKWGGFGVQLFFVISGYCVINAAISNLNKDNSVFSFTSARLKRIFIPYLLTLPFYFIFQWAGYFLVSHNYVHSNTNQYFNPVSQSLLVYFSNLTLTQIVLHQKLFNGVAWTLNYEVSFYVICSLLLLIAQFIKNERKIELLLNITHLFTIAILLISICNVSLLPFPFDLWSQFGLGICVYDLLQMRPSKSQKILCYSVFGLTIALCVRLFCAGILFGLRSSALSWLICFVFGCVLISCYRFDGEMLRNKIWYALGKIGFFSYSIYLIHPIVVTIASQVVSSLHLPNILSIVISILICSVAVLISWFVFNIIEKPTITKKRNLLQVEETRAATGS